MSNPSDLNIVPQPDTDKNFFNFKAVGLKIDKSYAIKFQWVYEDGTVSEWSSGKRISTVTEGVPDAPSATVPSEAIGNIPVTLSAFPANTKRVDIYIIGGVYDTGKVADSFFQAGTKNISVAAGTYQVSLIAVTPSGINGDPTNTFTIEISNIVTEDTVAPNAISAGVVTGGPNPSDPSGQTGYLNVQVTNSSTIPTDFAGYIVKIVSSTNTWNQTFSSSTALSNLYITGGIFVGQAYTLSVATTDGKNISSYVNCSPAPYTVLDNRTNSSTVSGDLTLSATDSILTVSWVASTDPYVDSYRVQITSSADTTFASPIQTVNTKSTNTSFGGLTANTAYRIRVTTRYGGSSGALSTTHTIGTATLNASGAISDGNVPTKNPGTGTEPAPVVKSLFKAFALTWVDINNPDQVTYEVYVKTVNSTNIVDPANLVMEINGTFAVINSLKDGTAIAYPAETSPTTATDYYFAVRAKDADGISSAAVTPVGPFTASRTGRFDIATDSIYANHIRTGEITADKMTTDLLFVNKTINVGESTTANRIRLASSIATPVVMTDPALASPSTYTVKSRIFIGAGNYFSNGTSFYADDTGRFSLADKLRFDGTNLRIDGSGTFSGTVSVGSGSNAISIGNDVQSTNDGIYIGGTGDYIYTDGRLRLGNGGITYASGTLTVTGNITANSIAANTSLSGLSITGTTGTIGGITLNSSGLSSTNFSISSTGLITANGGTIGGWTINSTQLRSSATNGTGKSYISLNPATPKIALVTGATFLNGAPVADPGQTGGGTELTIDPVDGIVGPNVTIAGNTGPGFRFSPNGEAVIRGTIYANEGIFSGAVSGANITMTGSATGYGTSSSRIFFEDSNYAVSAGSSTFEYQNNTGYFDIDGEWISTSSAVTVTNNDVRFTDATLAGGLPAASGTFSYGELWLGSGNSTGSGTVDLWANYPGDYIGISLVADKTTQNITIKGPSGAGFGTVHRSSSNLQVSSESPAILQVDSAGRLTRGRSIFSGSSSSPSANIGLQGDLYFSTAT
jgi:hypothetical protein